MGMNPQLWPSNKVVVKMMIHHEICQFSVENSDQSHLFFTLHRLKRSKTLRSPPRFGEFGAGERGGHRRNWDGLLNWLVVWIFFYIFPYIGNNHPN